jgi:hypothetical protein
MSYGCHPATGGACDCDWETDERGRDYFAQCSSCAQLWDEEPDAAWEYEEAEEADGNGGLSHPAAHGLCDCDWKTFGRRRDEFVQCVCCKELWKKYPAGSDWEETEREALRSDSAEALVALNNGEMARALEIVLERHLLWRSPVLQKLFQEWVPQLMEREDMYESMGGLLEMCAARVAPRSSS